MEPGVRFVLALIAVVGLTGIAYLVLVVARWVRQRSETHYVTSRPLRSPQFEPVVRRYYPPFDPEPEPEPEANAALERQNPEETGAFVLNPEECAAVARMIEHKATAEKPTKASCIWAGFGLKKGASSRYQRASEIYDALFVIQEEVRVTPIAGRSTPAEFASDRAR